LGLRKAPDHTTLYRFMRRLDERTLVAALNETFQRLPKTPDHHEHELAATVAVDATGLAPGAISTFYVRRTQNRGGEPMLWRRWLKWLVVVDTDRLRWCSPKKLALWSLVHDQAAFSGMDRCS
jgi:hypothetical protein